MSIPESIVFLNALTEVHCGAIGSARRQLSESISALLGGGLEAADPSEILFYHCGFRRVGRDDLKTVRDLALALREMARILTFPQTDNKGRLFDLLLVLHSETLAQCWDRHRRGFAA